MKTFKDLEFYSHPSIPDAERAFIGFDNGYEVSIVSGNLTCTDEEGPYELAILNDGVLCLMTPLTNGILGYLTEEDVTKVMIEIQKLK